MTETRIPVPNLPEIFRGKLWFDDSIADKVDAFDSMRNEVWSQIYQAVKSGKADAAYWKSGREVFFLGKFAKGDGLQLTYGPDLLNPSGDISDAKPRDLARESAWYGYVPVVKLITI